MHRFLILLAMGILATPASRGETALLKRFCSIWLTHTEVSSRWKVIEETLRSEIPVISPARDNPRFKRCLSELREPFEYAEFLSAGMRFMDSTPKDLEKEKGSGSRQAQIHVDGMPPVEIALKSQSASSQIMERSLRERKVRYEKLWADFLARLKTRVESQPF